METPFGDYPIRSAVIRVPVKATSTPALVDILCAPPAKTVSNGLPPPDEPRSDWPPSSAVCVGLAALVDDTVVVPLASVGVVLITVVLVSVGMLGIVVKISLLSGFEVVIVDVVIVDELSVVLVVGFDVDVSGVWLGVKKVCVVVDFTVEVTEVA